MTSEQVRNALIDYGPDIIVILIIFSIISLVLTNAIKKPTNINIGAAIGVVVGFGIGSYIMWSP